MRKIDQSLVMPYDPEAMAITVERGLREGLEFKEQLNFLDKYESDVYDLNWTNFLFYGRPMPTITVLTEDIDREIVSKLTKGQSFEIVLIPRQKPIPPATGSIEGLIASISVNGKYLYESPGLKLFRRIQAGQ